MKQLFIALLAIAFVPFISTAAKYEEGTHYSVIPGKGTAKPELREYFSYYCPACRRFESVLPDLKKTLPQGVPLTKTHVDFMGATAAENQFLLSKGLLLAERAGIAKEYNNKTFAYLQTERKQVNGIADVRKLFIAAGGDGAQFDKGIKSFAVVSQAKRNKKIQDKLSQGRYVKSVPTFVVNGKYAINSKALDQKNFVEDYKNIISYLLTLK